MPKYMELVNWIEEQIALKHLVPGQKMYSENELKDMFGISRQTVRHAIGILEQEGTLRRIQGSGTYINDSRVANLEKRSQVIVVTTYVDSYIFPRTIQGIENVLFEQGYSVQIAFTNNQNSKEKIVLEDIISRDEAAGVIMETVKSGIPNPNLQLYKEIKKRRIPVLFINSYYPELKIPHVSIDDYRAGKKATSHLIAMGHKKIGGIFKLDDGQGHKRYAGYAAAMNEAGLELEDSRVLWIDTEDLRNLERRSDWILSRIKGCTGLFCYNDQVAYGLMEILKDRGIYVPENLSLVSVDNSELAVMRKTKLSTVPHPMEHLGKKAAENLIEMIRNPAFDGTYEFDLELNLGNSVRKLV